MLWSDSTIVPNRIGSESASFKPFLGIRAAEIQESWSTSSWRYVPSEDNPADDLSRGITVEELSLGRWMNAPPFCLKPKTEWPNERTAVFQVQIEDLEKRKLSNSLATPTVVECKEFLELGEANASNEAKETSYCQRLGNNTRYAKKDPSELRREEVKPAECKEAQNYWIREAQRELVLTDYPHSSKID